MFTRNTLLELIGTNYKLVVSTVGNMQHDGKLEEIWCDRHYETMVFEVDKNDTTYYDIDVSKEISFESEWALKVTEENKDFVDNLANEMHENVVTEIMWKLLSYK